MKKEAERSERINERENSSLTLLRAGEVAKMLGLSRSKAYAMMAAHLVPTVRFGRSVRVPSSALEAWIKANMRQPEISAEAAA